MRWARLLWAATLVVAAAGWRSLVWDWFTPVPGGFFGVRGFSGLFAVSFGGVGALLTWRRPGHRVGAWVFAAAGMVGAVDFASFEYGLAASAGRGLLFGEYVGWLQLWIWVPFVALITVYLFLLFPAGRPPGPRWRLVSWMAGGFVAIAITGLALTPGPGTGRTCRGCAIHSGSPRPGCLPPRPLPGLLGWSAVLCWRRGRCTRAPGGGRASGSRSGGWPTPGAWWPWYWCQR